MLTDISIHHLLDAAACRSIHKLKPEGACRPCGLAVHACLSSKSATQISLLMQDLSTFGFRGEALSSLCALANITVTTRTAEQAAAVRLVYGHSGALVSNAPAARAVGTTVAVGEIFKPLPVRFKVCL